MAIISKLIEGLTNDVEHFVRVYPINPKGFAQSELDGQVASAMPIGGIPITNLPVGTLIKFPINDVETVGIIVNRGIPSNSDLYDSSCDGVWIMTKELYDKRAFDTTNNDYENSDIHAYLNDVLLGMMPVKLQNEIKQVKIPYSKGVYPYHSVAIGENGLSTKIFLLSGYEMNWTTSNNSVFPVDGATVEYFKGCSAVDSKRIAYYNNVATNWWLRSMVRDGTSYAWSVHTTGDYQNLSVDSSATGVRPAFVLPHDALIVPEPNADGSYNLLV